MSTLEEATKPRDTSQMTPVEPPAPSTPPPNPNVPGASPFLRSPLPVSGSPPDSQRQYYVGPVPLTRIIPPPPLTAPAGGGGTVGPTGARGPQGAQGIPGPLNVTHTNPFTAHNIIIGNGGDDIEPLGALGTTTTVLHGNASGDPSFGSVVEADISLSNVTTNNVTTSKHGFAPILPNDATKFLDGTGAWTVPPGSGTVPTFVDSEIPSGTINSSNVTFTLAHTPSPSTSLTVFLNGVRERITTDYTLATATITFGAAPSTGDNIYVSYRY